MYCVNPVECFVKYLESKGIKQVKCFESIDENFNIDYSAIKNQVEIISEFHIKTLGYTGYMNKRIDNNIWKVIEQYKIYIKRIEKHLRYIEDNGAKNEFEELMLKHGYTCLERAKKCIHNIYKCDYMNLIMRSMKKAEMCLGNTYFNNLRKTESIEVIDINNCCYDMVEMDLAYFLSKIKRKKAQVDFYNLIGYFCKLESLNNDSIDFILSIMSYPYEFIKYCNRYREKAKNWTDEEYALKLKKAIIVDGESLI
ncbi:spore coat protein [Clostridium sp. DJ247]|uniref:spore coat protein n=1 Tax=Clostridium sp. DJ247 TaxID=2726188 RepID=UPI00162933EC|nr:spore coat protein [Clostridium sp. DJ247]MBC2579902.1 spore coat protein [Clostridium sp. DJ247]